MKLYVLMAGSVPIDASKSKDQAMHDAWLMTEGDKYAETKVDYWVKEVTIDEEEYEVMCEPVFPHKL